MARTVLDVRKAEISALVDGVVSLERDLHAKGIDASDPFDRMEAMDTIGRIERRMAAQQPTDAYQEAES
jgi:hypothetical protein